MTNSRSTVSRNRCLALSIAIAIVMALAGSAFAGPRKRVVVLEFRGPNATKFHADVVKILRVRHTVVSVEKWESAAEDEGATKVNSKNVKKIARKLNVDGVIVGEVERRRERHILRLKVREGRTGDYMQANPIEVTSGDDRLDNRASRDLKEELLDTIDTLDVAVTKRGNDDDDEDEDDEEDEPRGKSKKGKGRDDDRDDEEDEPRTAKGKGKSKGRDDRDDEEDEPRGKSKFGKDDDDEDDDARGRDRVAKGTNGRSKGTNGRSKKGSDDDDDDDVFVDEDDLGSSRGRSAGDDDDRDRDDDEDDDDDDRDRTASADDDDDGGDEDVSDRIDDDEEDSDDGADLSGPGMRAVDAVIGLSVSARRLGFTYSSNLMNDARPLGYRGAPVAGIYFEADIFPLALSKKNRSMTRHIGINVLADRVIGMKTRIEDMAGEINELATGQRRYGAGVVVRYPLGSSAVLNGRARYSRLTFAIDKASAPAGVTVDVPNVKYGMIEPALGVTYLATPKIAIGLEAAFLLTLTTGEIGDSTQYGGATVTGIDGELHGDYMITSKIFARTTLRLMTLGYKFKGTGDLIDRDGDGAADVFGARDSFFGMTATMGYVF